jgi:hypothetical protein
MSDTTAVVDAYLDALSETDPATCTELVERAWTPEGHFVDPLLEARGHEALAALADAVTGAYPGHAFRRTTGIDAHHGLIRFAWELVGPDGAVAATGVDVGIVGDDGRLTNIAGFFGEPPALEAA